jgi:hypothetical protein
LQDPRKASSPNEALWVDEQACCAQRGMCHCDTAIGGRPRDVLDQDRSPPMTKSEKNDKSTTSGPTSLL